MHKQRNRTRANPSYREDFGDGTLVAETRDVTYRLAAGFLLLLAGCPVGSADDTDTDGGGDGDGSSSTSGITVTWGCTPDVPGPVTSDILVV